MKLCDFCNNPYEYALKTYWEKGKVVACAHDSDIPTSSGIRSNADRRQIERIAQGLQAQEKYIKQNNL